MERPQGCEARREAGGIALERRVQVLDEVDLVDVAAPDRLADCLDCARVALVVPGAPPLADRERAGCARLLVPRVDPGGEARQPAGLGRVGPGGAAQGAGDAIAEEDVGDEIVARAEARVVEVALELGEGVVSAPDLQHADNASAYA